MGEEERERESERIKGEVEISRDKMLQQELHSSRAVRGPSCQRELTGIEERDIETQSEKKHPDHYEKAMKEKKSERCLAARMGSDTNTSKIKKPWTATYAAKANLHTSEMRSRESQRDKYNKDNLSLFS